MPTVLSFFLRALLLAAGLVFAASLVVVFLVLLALWCVGALWYKLTGRPPMPFTVRFRAAEGFQHMYRRAPQRSPARRSDADVTDVDVKRLD